MVLHVLDALAQLRLDQCVVVVGHRAEWVTKTLAEEAPAGRTLVFVHQERQRGTGDAVSVGLTGLSGVGPHVGGDVIVVPGDTPLLTHETLFELVSHHRNSGAGATLLTANLSDPYGYGRVVRGKNTAVLGVVEETDATVTQIKIGEVNTSIYCFRQEVLAPALRRLRPQNAQGEYYLTDVISVLVTAGFGVEALCVKDPAEAAGVNDRVQLAYAEAALRRRINNAWMRSGVTMIDPERVAIDTTVEIGADVTLWPGVVLKGATRIGAGSEIGPDSTVSDATIGERSELKNCVVERAHVGDDVKVGPYCVLSAGAWIENGEVVAPFTLREAQVNPPTSSAN
jgi:bifunctional UDP-N-acetylglucosamine pyrophosphorylase/glucosamine-1-phosphate N-acetyltransferase